AARVWPVLSAVHDVGRRPPSLVRALLRLRRDQLHLLRAALAPELAAVGRADASGFPLPRQGLQPHDRPPPSAGHPSARDPPAAAGRRAVAPPRGAESRADPA